MKFLMQEGQTEDPYDYCSDAIQDHSSRGGQFFRYADPRKVEEGDRDYRS